MKIQRLTKANGRCCVAAAAYRAAEKIHHNILGTTFDYGDKKGLVHSEIQLPKNAPERLGNREILWNSVEDSELRNPKANTAIEVLIALPRELKPERQIELVREFCQKEFIEKGQIADWSIHLPDEKQNNPHAHILLTTRPILENGKWGEKEKKVYKKDEEGNRIPVIDPATGEQKIGARGRKLWQREKAELCDWNQKGWYKEVRTVWQDVANSYLDPQHQIDMRSYKERYPNPEDRPQAQQHEGVAARRIDERYKIWKEQFIENPNIEMPEPEMSEVCENNRQVRANNQLLEHIKELSQRIDRWSKDRFKNLFFSEQELEFLQRKTELFATITNKQWESYYTEEKKRIVSDMRFSFSKWIGKNQHFIEKAYNKIITDSHRKMAIEEHLEEERKHEEFKTYLMLAQYDMARKAIATMPQEFKEEVNKAFRDTKEYQFLQERMKQLEEENGKRIQSEAGSDKTTIFKAETKAKETGQLLVEDISPSLQKRTEKD